MSAQIEAGRLSHVDLGKTVTVHITDDLGAMNVTAVLSSVRHTPESILLMLGPFVRPALLDPHTLVTITGNGGHDGK